MTQTRDVSWLHAYTISLPSEDIRERIPVVAPI